MLTAVNHTMRDFKINQDLMPQTEEYLKTLQDLYCAKIKRLEDTITKLLRGLEASKLIEIVCNDLDTEITKFYQGIDVMRQGELSILIRN